MIINFVYNSHYLNNNSKNKKPEGISIDIANIISKKLNIDIELQVVDSFEEALNFIKEHKADILIGIPNNYSFMDEYNLYMTKSYISSPIFKIENKLTVNANRQSPVLICKFRY